MTHSLFAVYDRLVQAILGLATALLIVGIGLWVEAAAPTLPGARPMADVYSVVSHLGYSLPRKNHIPLAYLDAMASADPTRQWLGALSRQRFVIRPDANVESPFGISTAIRILGAQNFEWLPALMLAILGATIWVVAVAGLLLRHVNEEHLMSAIKA